MEVRQHPTSPSNMIVRNPTPEALKVARRLEPNNWAKIQPSGSIVIHVKVRNQFESLLPQAPVVEEPVVEPFVPEFQSRDEMIDWLWENINSSKVVSYIERGPLGHKRWNELYAGKMTARQVEEKYKADANL